MAGEERARRSDAERNRQRLLEAAAAVFAERGYEAGVGEVAARAGVGRGTLFRNFPTKADLIAAIAVDRMRQTIEDGRRLMDDGADDASMVFTFLGQIIRLQQENRALVEAVADEFLKNAEIRAIHDDLVVVIDELLERGKAAGSVRPEVGALDVVMLVKGVCSAASAIEMSPEMLERHIALVLSAISTPAYTVPLTGSTPTLADLAPQPAV